MPGEHRLPLFSVAEYIQLLEALQAAGYTLAPVTAMKVWAGERIAYLRHDVDLHVPDIETMARAERAIGVQATYLVMVSQHYNPWYPPNASVIRRVSAMGHEIGLHYDLSDYPVDPTAARERLDSELSAVSALTNRRVSSISMHQPHLGHEDWFRHGSGLVHPHDRALQDDLLYVSDSCRAWRDESLLRCFSDEPPQRLQLLTHPELWLDGSVVDRQHYLNQVLLPRILSPQREFIVETVRQTWLHHDGARAHDEREARGAVAIATCPGNTDIERS